MKPDLKHPGTTYQTPHAELIEKCRMGDHASQFMIYKLYYKAMYNTALRIVKDTMEAVDIMQESFLTAFEKIDTFSGTVAFGAWLKKIVLNKALDSLRKSGKMVFSDLESALNLKEYPGEENHNNDYVNEQLGRLKTALAELPEKYSNIINLHFFEGYDYSEISQILNTPQVTIRSQVNRARKMVKSVMA
jgi:RNA polymerase sigma-70 factor (ECF subfamily)